MLSVNNVAKRHFDKKYDNSDNNTRIRSYPRSGEHLLSNIKLTNVSLHVCKVPVFLSLFVNIYCNLEISIIHYLMNYFAPCITKLPH